MFEALLFSKHRDLYRRKVGFFAARYYLILVFFIGAFLFFVLGFPTIATVFFASWLVATTAFFFERTRKRRRRDLAVIVLMSLPFRPVAPLWRLYGAWKFRTFFY